MSNKNSLYSLFVSLFLVIVIISWLANWNFNEIKEIVIDILNVSLMTMSVVWLILAASSTSILYRGSAPRTQSIVFLFLSIGGLGLVEIISGGLPRGTFAIITVQWAGLLMGAAIVLFTVLAIATGREEEEDTLLALDD